MSDFYRFPRARFADDNTFSQQFKHIRSEVDEVWQELELIYPDIKHPVRVAEELLDLVHSSETGLRILADRYGVNVEALRQQVLMKNQSRGYYDVKE